MSATDLVMKLNDNKVRLTGLRERRLEPILEK